MLPGFITLYKEDNLIHLYFFRGLTDDNHFYYKDLDMSNCQYKYNMKTYEDKAIDYIFDNPKIKSIRCKLINYKLETENFLCEL